MTELEEIGEANEVRKQYLMQRGIQVPVDQMYVVSLLEFILGPELDEAKLYHEQRIAPILDKSIGGLQVLQQQRQSAQARKTLLEGVR